MIIIIKTPRFKLKNFNFNKLFREQTKVVYDPKLGPYDLMMTKVDVKNGYYGENVFYKMQVLHQINRDVYILFTRYGRIGDMG